MIFQKSSVFLLCLPIIMTLGGCSSSKKVSEKSFRLEKPRIAPLAESEWNERQRELLGPYIKSDGSVLNVLTTIARHPDLFESFMPFVLYVLEQQTLPARDREMLILRIGWLNQANYEFGQHTLAGKQAGLTDEEILRIAKGPDDPGWNNFDAALIRAADELYSDAIISDATWNTLSQYYEEKQLMDVVFTVGQYNLVSWILNSFGVQLEEGVPGFPEGSNKQIPE
jgi:4-carboxymuconolactone decarboxylase